MLSKESYMKRVISDVLPTASVMVSDYLLRRGAGARSQLFHVCTATYHSVHRGRLICAFASQIKLVLSAMSQDNSWSATYLNFFNGALYDDPPACDMLDVKVTLGCLCKPRCFYLQRRKVCGAAVGGDRREFGILRSRRLGRRLIYNLA